MPPQLLSLWLEVPPVDDGHSGRTDEDLIKAAGFKHSVGPGFDLGFSGVLQVLLDSGRQGTEAASQQTMQQLSFSQGYTALDALFDALFDTLLFPLFGPGLDPFGQHSSHLL